MPYAKDKKDDNTKKEDGPQVFVMPMSGGDAKKITNAPRGIEQFAWRPNGKDIAYVTSDDPPSQKEIEKHNDSFEVGDNDYLTTAAPTPSHIWLLSAEGGDAKRLTSGHGAFGTFRQIFPLRLSHPCFRIADDSGQIRTVRLLRR